MKIPSFARPHERMADLWDALILCRVSLSLQFLPKLREASRTPGEKGNHSDWVNGVAIKADGMRAISASNDKTLKLWDL